MPSRSSTDDYDRMAFAVVPPDKAKQDPYPYVWVTETGAVHELDAQDRTYLETRFHPCDGGRPYIKSRYTTKDGWGSLKGICPRSKIPRKIPIMAEPVTRGPVRPIEEVVRELTEKAGYSVVKNPDGTLTATPPANAARRSKANRKPWWRFW